MVNKTCARGLSWAGSGPATSSSTWAGITISIFRMKKPRSNELRIEDEQTHNTVNIVGDLVDLLVQNEFLAPVSLLLPGAIPQTVNTLPCKEAVTVEQNQRPFCGKDRKDTKIVIPVWNPE